VALPEFSPAGLDEQPLEDAAGGKVLWRFTPPGYAGWAGSEMITQASPVADPARRFLYSASPDGRVHKLSVATGREAAGWPVTITRNPEREKIASALNLARGLVLAATGGYIGDAPPYQGHVVAIGARAGRIVSVWNSLCSDRSGLHAPASCRGERLRDLGPLGRRRRAGDGKPPRRDREREVRRKRYWGDSALRLTANATRLLQNWTPRNQQELEQGDLDLGSTAPALLGSGLAVQGGKDGLLRLLDLRRLNGRDAAGAVTGGELQIVRTPGGSLLDTRGLAQRGADLALRLDLLGHAGVRARRAALAARLAEASRGHEPGHRRRASLPL